MKILFVCLGNICRSPLAEGIMRHLVAEQNLDWTVASAGTGDWHIGHPPDKRSTAVAKIYGYDISTQRAQHFNHSFFAKYDRIFVMDRNNLRDVLALAKTAEDRAKVSLFIIDGEVADPYYNNALFDPVCQQVEARCRQIIDELH